MENTDQDWVWDDEEGLKGPSDRIMARGPDSMRQGADPRAGTGRPFIFLPDGQLVWGERIGHEAMLDKNSPGFDRLLRACFHDPEQYNAVAEESSYQGEPFFERDVVRFRMVKAGAMFGRLGHVEGYNLLAIWPGTPTFTSALPLLIDDLLHQGEIDDNTRISVGSRVKYTVGHFLRKKAEVLSQLKKANDEGADLLRSGGRYLSSKAIHQARQIDKEYAASGKRPFQYTFRYGETFRDYLRRAGQ